MKAHLHPRNKNDHRTTPEFNAWVNRVMRAWKTDVPDAGIHTDTLVKGYEAGKTPTQFLREGGYLETVNPHKQLRATSDWRLGNTPTLSPRQLVDGIQIMRKMNWTTVCIAAELGISKAYAAKLVRIADHVDWRILFRWKKAVKPIPVAEMADISLLERPYQSDAYKRLARNTRKRVL